MRLFLIAFAILLSTGCAASWVSTLPPELSDVESIPLNFNEPPLWRDGDLAGHQTRIRVSFQSIRLHNGIAVVRVDHDASGRSFGVVVRGDLLSAGGRINERRSFPVSDSDWAQLDQLILNPRLFARYPEFWENSNPDEICVDGVGVVLERVNGDGYKLSEANVSCAAPREFVDVVRKLIQLSSDDSLNSFLE